MLTKRYKTKKHKKNNKKKGGNAAVAAPVLDTCRFSASFAAAAERDGTYIPYHTIPYHTIPYIYGIGLG